MSLRRCRVVIHEPIFCACGKNSIEPPSDGVPSEMLADDTFDVGASWCGSAEACGTDPPRCQEPCAQLFGTSNAEIGTCKGGKVR